MVGVRGGGGSCTLVLISVKVWGEGMGERGGGARVVWLVLKTLGLSVVGYIIDVDCLRGLSLLL